MSFASAVFVGLLLSAPVVAEPLVEGRVRLSSGAPASSVQVLLFDMTALERGPVAQATTDASGYFALRLASLSGPALPESFGLGPNYPNPFNPSTIIPYQLPIAARVRLEVFNVLGQRVATLVNGDRPAGFHSAVWDATNGSGQAAAAGVYIYRLTAAGAQHTGRMVLVDGQAGTAAVSAAGVLGVPAEPAERTYGIVVAGAGVDAAFAVRAGMGPVEFVVDSTEPAGKATSDCSLADILMSKDGCAENPILTEVPEGYTAPPDTTNGEDETPENEEDEQPETLLPKTTNECAETPTLTDENEQSEPAPPGASNGEVETPTPTNENDEQTGPVPPGATNGEVETPTLTDEDEQSEPAPPGTSNECAERPILTENEDDEQTEPAPPDTTNGEVETPILTDEDDEQTEPAPPDTTNGRGERPILTERDEDDEQTEPAPPDTTNGRVENPILTDRDEDDEQTEPAPPDTTNGRVENPIPTENEDDDQTEPAPPDTTGYDQ